MLGCYIGYSGWITLLTVLCICWRSGASGFHMFVLICFYYWTLWGLNPSCLHLYQANVDFSAHFPNSVKPVVCTYDVYWRTKQMSTKQWTIGGKNVLTGTAKAAKGDIRAEMAFPSRVPNYELSRTHIKKSIFLFFFGKFSESCRCLQRLNIKIKNKRYENNELVH